MPRPSLNTQMTQKMCIRVLKSTIEERKLLILFDNMIADVIGNKKLHAVANGLFNSNNVVVFCFFHSLLSLVHLIG